MRRTLGDLPREGRFGHSLVFKERVRAHKRAQIGRVSHWRRGVDDDNLGSLSLPLIASSFLSGGEFDSASDFQHYFWKRCCSCPAP